MKSTYWLIGGIAAFVVGYGTGFLCRPDGLAPSVQRTPEYVRPTRLPENERMHLDQRPEAPHERQVQVVREALDQYRNHLHRVWGKPLDPPSDWDPAEDVAIFDAIAEDAGVADYHTRCDLYPCIAVAVVSDEALDSLREEYRRDVSADEQAVAVNPLEVVVVATIPLLPEPGTVADRPFEEIHWIHTLRRRAKISFEP